MRCCREAKSARPKKENQKHNRHRRGSSCGQHQSQRQPTIPNDGFNTHSEQGTQQSGSGHSRGVPPSPASSDVAPSPGEGYGASCNPRENPNAHQPGTFPIVDGKDDGGPAFSARLPPALRGENILFSQDARVISWCSAQSRPVLIVSSPSGFPLNTSSRIFGLRSDTATPAFARSPRSPSPPVTKFQGAMLATGASALSAAPLSQGTGASTLSVFRSRRDLAFRPPLPSAMYRQKPAPRAQLLSASAWGLRTKRRPPQPRTVQ